MKYVRKGGAFASKELYPEVSNIPAVQRRYEEMRRNGESHKMAEMLAFGQLPGVKTDTRFHARLNRNQNLPPLYYQRAKAAGVITNDKQYISQLADYPGDPKAWVGGDARSEIKRRCEHRGWECEGAVEVKAPDDETPDEKPYGVADSIVNRTVNQALELDPGAGSTPQKLKNLRDDTRTRITGDGAF